MIIDTHVHHGSTKDFFMPDEMVDEMIKKYDIDYIILSNCRGCERTEDLQFVPKEAALSQCQVLQESIDFARNHSGKVFVMPWIKPVVEGINDDFIKLIEDNLDIVKGIKFHAHNSVLAADSPEIEPYIKLAEKYNLPIAIHTGGIEEASSKYVYNAALKHPDVNFIMVHMDLGTDNRQAIDYISKLPNLYGDTTWVSIDSLMYFLEKCGSDRIVFGTDSPIDGTDTYSVNKFGEPSLYRQYFNDLPKLVSKEVYEKIMFKNAIKLFNLDI